ncbi:MAG: carboxypeptidase-like regulatory domain-containing protein, partial [bacterium]|nr:carboxypeptidase-like regulatory domain-containing protein [bacterium]
MSQLITKTTRLILVIGFLFSLPAVSSAATIDGLIRNESGAPIQGVSVRAVNPNIEPVGTMTDKFGRFELHLNDSTIGSIRLVISSVGYTKKELTLSRLSSTISLQVALSEQAIELSTLSVASTTITAKKTGEYKEEQIVNRSRQSILPTDPISAVREASVQRVGSNHSSKIRVHGTSPDFYLNSLPIGNDPNHYGVFSFIPAPALSEIHFYAQGSSAAYELPSVVDLKTPNRFVTHESGEFNLSVVEATGTVSVGSEHAFVLGSLRKSVLDKLVNKIEFETGRATLPPTNFQDIMVTSGVKFSSRYQLFLDQYHVSDFLAFNTERLSELNQFNTFQHMQSNYVALRFNRLGKSSLIRAFGSVKQGTEIYRVAPPEVAPLDELNPGELYIDLNATEREYGFGIDGEIISRATVFKTGGSLLRVPKSEVSLRQQNWNFLPPDASSDNPFLYQADLNRQYGHYELNRKESSTAFYGSIERQFGPAKIESGLRF